jgi:hypothetical protein
LFCSSFFSCHTQSACKNKNKKKEPSKKMKFKNQI